MSEKTGLYILKGHIPVEVSNYDEWHKWFMIIENRRVAKTQISPGIEISTVFLGIDASGADQPLLFETISSGGSLTEEAEQYQMWEEAEEGHKRWVEKARKAELQKG